MHRNITIYRRIGCIGGIWYLAKLGRRPVRLLQILKQKILILTNLWNKLKLIVELGYMQYRYTHPLFRFQMHFDSRFKRSERIENCCELYLRWVLPWNERIVYQRIWHRIQFYFVRICQTIIITVFVDDFFFSIFQFPMVEWWCS